MRDRRLGGGDGRLPSEAGEVAGEPELEPEGLHGLQVGEHVPEGRARRRELGGDGGEPGQRDPQHDGVEVGAPRTSTSRFVLVAPRQGPRRLEVDARRREIRAALDLLVAGRAGPAGEPGHVDEGIVGVARQRDLPDQIDGSDGSAIGREVQVACHAVEELELHAPLLQHLVEGGEDGVAHPGLHLPEDGAAVGEEHPAEAVERHPRGDAAALGVAADHAEDEVVAAADRPRRQGDRVGAVPLHPGAEVDIVDAAPRMEEQPVAEEAHRDRAREVHLDPEEVRGEVGGDAVAEHRPHRLHEGVDEPGDRRDGGGRVLRRVGVEGPGRCPWRRPGRWRRGPRPGPRWACRPQSPPGRRRG